MSARRFGPARAVEVAADPRGDPVAVRWRGRTERVARVAERWEVVEGWWRGTADPRGGATRRRYYRLVTRAGTLCVVYHDLASGRWFLERIID